MWIELLGDLNSVAPTACLHDWNVLLVFRQMNLDEVFFIHSFRSLPSLGATQKKGGDKSLLGVRGSDPYVAPMATFINPFINTWNYSHYKHHECFSQDEESHKNSCIHLVIHGTPTWQKLDVKMDNW